jgi:hypothetical protein
MTVRGTDLPGGAAETVAVGDANTLAADLAVLTCDAATRVDAHADLADLTRRAGHTVAWRDAHPAAANLAFFTSFDRAHFADALRTEFLDAHSVDALEAIVAGSLGIAANRHAAATDAGFQRFTEIVAIVDFTVAVVVEGVALFGTGGDLRLALDAAIRLTFREPWAAHTE